MVRVRKALGVANAVAFGLYYMIPFVGLAAVLLDCAYNSNP